MRRVWRTLPMVIAMASMLWAGSSAAEETTIREDAQALFDQGLKHMLASRFKLGCALIKRSLEVDPRPGTLFTLAECYGRAGKYASAVELYDEYLSMYANLSEEQKKEQRERYRISKQERKKLLKSVPWLTVVLPQAAPPETVVNRNGEPFAESLFDVAIAVDPGPQVFTSRAPGGPLVEQRVDLSPGQRKTVVLDVLPAGASVADDTQHPELDASEEPTADSGSNAHRAWMWVTASVGLAALATGGVTGFILLDKRNTIREKCRHPQSDGTIACEDGAEKEAAQAQDVFAPVTTVALGVGVGALTIATILWATDDSDAPKSAAAARPSISVDPRGGAALGLRGHF